MTFLAAAAPYLMMAGAGVSAVSSVAGGIQQKAAMESQAKAARYNQSVAEANAQAVEAAAAREAEVKRREGIKLLGSQRAAYAGAGVTMEGTPLEVMAQTAFDLEEEAQATKYNYDVQAARWRSQAGFYGYEAERQKSLAGTAVTQGFLKAGTSLLMGAGQLGAALGKKAPGADTGLSWGLA